VYLPLFVGPRLSRDADSELVVRHWFRFGRLASSFASANTRGRTRPTSTPDDHLQQPEHVVAGRASESDCRAVSRGPGVTFTVSSFVLRRNRKRASYATARLGDGSRRLRCRSIFWFQKIRSECVQPVQAQRWENVGHDSGRGQRP